MNERVVMNSKQSTVSATLVDKLATWLKQSALQGLDLESLVNGTCERLSAAGMPLMRATVSFSMLHPLYDALSFTWLRGEGIKAEGFRVRDDHARPEMFLKSPFYHLLQHNLEHLRRRLDPAVPVEFPIFTDLIAMGGTDYLAFMQSFAAGEGRGMMGSWTTHVPDGFTEDMIKVLIEVEANLAVAAKMAVLDKLADNLLSTYLGVGAGRRVLSGQTRRGDGDTIRAILVMGDMRDSTAVAETEGRQAYIDTLNDFFDAIATPFNRNGGEILSFIGDGFLAVFPCERHKAQSAAAAAAAMAAVREANARMARLNERRAELQLDPVRFGLGLHVGNVMFGNVGLKSRLTFSAFGSAVNEVQRLENLTKKYRTPVIASRAFVGYSGGEWDLQGVEALRGTKAKVALYAPTLQNLTCSEADVAREDAGALGSDAEQVMLLYRSRTSVMGAAPSPLQLVAPRPAARQGGL